MSDAVFVSYSRHDAAEVLPVVDALRASGIPVWLDQLSIPASVPWFDEIDYAVRGAVLVVAFDSPAWRASESCRAERELATSLGKRTLTFTVSEVDSPRASTDAVMSALEETTNAEAVRARLLASAQRWAKAGRRNVDLASGATLRAFRALPVLVVGEDAVSHDFLHRSRRRSRRRRIVASLVSVGTAGVLLVGQNMKTLFSETRATVSANDERLGRVAAAASVGRANPYAGLSAALAATTGAGEYLGRLVMASATALNVPVSALATSTLDWAPATPLSPGTAIHRTNRTATVRDKPDRVEISDATGLLRSLPANGPIHAFAWEKESGWLAMADPGGIHVVDPATAREVVTLRGAEGVVASVTWTGRNSVEGRSSGGGSATWEVVEADTLADTGEWFMELAAAPDGRSMAGVSRDGRVVQISMNGPPIVSKGVPLEGSGRAAWITWTPRGWAVIRDSDVVVVINDQGQRSYPLKGCTARGLAWNPRSERVLIACLNTAFAELDLESGHAPVRTVGTYPESVAISPDGTQYLGSQYGEILTTDQVETGRLFRSVQAGCPLSARIVRVAPNSSLVANAGNGMNGLCLQISVRDGSNWEHLQALTPSHEMSDSRAAAFSHDNSMFAMGFLNGDVWVLDPTTLDTRLIASVTGSEIRGVEFTADDSALVVITRAGQVLTVPMARARMSVAQLRTLIQERMKIGVAGHLTTLTG